MIFLSKERIYFLCLRFLSCALDKSPNCSGLAVSLGGVSWCNNDKTHLENDNASIERMRTYNVCHPSLPIVGWGDSVLCQYVNNGPLYYYYYVCNEIFPLSPPRLHSLKYYY